MIHYEWSDKITINKNRLKRWNGSQDEADVIFNNKIIEVIWDKWEREYYLLYNNNYLIVDKCDEIYIDYINKIIYRPLNDSFSYINYSTDKIIEEKIEFSNEEQIPNIFHFIYGLLPQITEFELYHYLSVKSAIDVNNPEKVYFYYYYQPYGTWWDKLDDLSVNKIKLSDEEFNIEINGKKINHYAHKADIIRLKKINEYGGIYLDIDTICIKSFNNLLKNDFVMGIQGEEYGLCNAVILSKPNSYFSRKWLEEYSSFRSIGRDEFWDEHSVKLPLELSKKYPQHIKVLNNRAFFYPLWNDINEILFTEYNESYKEIYKNIITNNYCIHLWDTYSHDYLKNLTKDVINSSNTIYNIIARKFIEPTISLVFLTYNRNDMTIECLNSYLEVLNKNYIKELIILDNNSNKELKDFLNNFQNNHDKIKIIFSNKNLGVCGGRRILFREATGSIIASLDSDAKLLNPIFFEESIKKLYQEEIGIVGISGAFIKSWEFGKQEDITDDNENEYYCHHIAGCCQIFRRDMALFGVELDPYYDKFWVEDTDFSMQFLELGKKNYRFSQKNRIKHNWGGSGGAFIELFEKNRNYFVEKWRNKIDLANVIP